MTSAVCTRPRRKVPGASSIDKTKSGFEIHASTAVPKKSRSRAELAPF